MQTKAPCKRTQHRWPTTPNFVGCYMLRPFVHPVACCWMLLRVVAQSLKPVKLLATYKRTQQLPKRYKILITLKRTIVKYFVTNLNNLKTKNRSGHLVDWCPRSFEMQAFGFRLSVAKREACSQAFLAETVETGDKNHDDFLCMQMSLVMCTRFVFDDWNDACKLNTFSLM